MTACPKCGGVRTRTRETSWDAEGRRLRLRICADCHHRYGTIEVPLPDDVTYFMAASFRKYQNRMRMRRKRGYQGGIGGSPIKPEPVLRVSVSVDRRAA